MANDSSRSRSSFRPGKRTQALIRVLIGLVILLLLFYKVGFDRIAESLSRLNLWALPWAILFFSFYLLLGSLGSWVLLKPFSPMSWLEFIPCFLPSWAIGLFFPGKLGEASIVYYLKKKEIPLGRGTAFFVVGKTLTVCALGMVAATGFFTFFPLRAALQLLLLLLAILGAFFFVLLSGFSRKWMRRMLPKKIQETFSGFLSDFSLYFREHKGLLALSLVFKLFSFGAVAGMNYWIFDVGLGVRIPVHQILQISTIETFSALIPVSINGLGVRQAAGIYLYGLIGVDAPIVASSQIVGWVLIYLFGAAAWLLRFGPVDPPSKVDL